MTKARARWLAVLLAVVLVAVGIAAALLLPQLGVLSLAVAVIVLLHVVGYIALGILRLLLGPQQVARLRSLLRRWRWRRSAAPLADSTGGSPPPATPPTLDR